MRFMTFLALGPFAVTAATAGAQSSFDSQSHGQTPSGWTCGATGRGAAKWRIEADAQAPSPPNVLTQRGRADFPWCIQEGGLAENGTVMVSFKAISGEEDQAGGVVWRWKDANTYYVARGNALENNVSLYYVSRGVRHTIKYQSAPVARNTWHRLEVRFEGERIQVYLNGKSYIDLSDRNISGTGKAGVWTKADSITSFDDFQMKANN
jgi:hypothetical protein